MYVCMDQIEIVGMNAFVGFQVWIILQLIIRRTYRIRSVFCCSEPTYFVETCVPGSIEIRKTRNLAHKCIPFIVIGYLLNHIYKIVYQNFCCLTSFYWKKRNNKSMLLFAQFRYDVINYSPESSLSLWLFLYKCHW